MDRFRSHRLLLTRVLIALSAVFGLVCLAEAQGLADLAAREKERRKKTTRTAPAYTDAALASQAQPGGAPRAAPTASTSSGWVGGVHYVDVKLFRYYPAGTSMAECRALFAADEEKGIGRRSGHCDCPGLTPHGKVVSSELLGGDVRDEVGDRVGYGVKVRLGCDCSDASQDSPDLMSFASFTREVRRLKNGCATGQQEYCRPFEDALARMEDLCNTKFSDEPSCRGYVAALRDSSSADGVKLLDSPVEHRETFNMPCSGGPLKTCEECVRFQMELHSFVENVGRERCREGGFPTLIGYRNLSCSLGSGSPNPVYEADCGH